MLLLLHSQFSFTEIKTKGKKSLNLSFLVFSLLLNISTFLSGILFLLLCSFVLFFFCSIDLLMMRRFSFYLSEMAVVTSVPFEWFFQIASSHACVDQYSAGNLRRNCFRSLELSALSSSVLRTLAALVFSYSQFYLFKFR